MVSRYGAVRGRPNRHGPGKWHLVDLDGAAINGLGERLSLCGYVWGNPFVKDVPKLNCKVCIKIKEKLDA
jgi:hypothetical protein